MIPRLHAQSRIEDFVSLHPGVSSGDSPRGVDWRDLIPVISVALVVMLFTVICIGLTRRRRRRRQRRQAAASTRAAMPAGKTGHLPGGSRPEHRSRNPTLAESGGLPPLRDPNQPPAAN